MKTRFVTLLKYLEPMEAHILKGRLEAEGIPCFLADENITTLNPFYGQAVGGVKLKVNAQDAQRASEILAIDKIFTHNDYFPEPENEAAGPGIECPVCKQPAGRLLKRPFISNVISALKGILTGGALQTDVRAKCSSCRAEWTIEG